MYFIGQHPSYCRNEIFQLFCNSFFLSVVIYNWQNSNFQIMFVLPNVHFCYIVIQVGFFLSISIKCNYLSLFNQLKIKHVFLSCIVSSFWYFINLIPDIALVLVSLGLIFFFFFTGVQKRILMHYSVWSQIIRNIPISKWCIQLSSNLICAMQQWRIS